MHPAAAECQQLVHQSIQDGNLAHLPCVSQQQRLQSGIASERLRITVTCVDNKKQSVRARIGYAFEAKATHVIACLDIGK